ncbi:MAG: hypothetical protein QM768_00055 [Agriterribacter sp.]
MRTLNGLLIILFITGISLNATAQHDTILIRQSFDDLKYAILERDGNKAINYIDKNTFTFYSNIFLKVKMYDSVSVEALPIFEKILVFAARFKNVKDNIKSMSDSAFFKYAVKENLVGNFGNPIGGSDLGKITTFGDSARGQLMISLIDVPFSQIMFHHEDKKWKVDLTYLIPISNLALKHLVITSKKSDTEFIISMIKSSGVLNDEHMLWQPLNTKN